MWQVTTLLKSPVFFTIFKSHDRFHFLEHGRKSKQLIRNKIYEISPKNVPKIRRKNGGKFPHIKEIIFSGL